MNLIIAHTRWMTLDLLRQPSYMVSTIAFPALFYIIFAIPESKDIHSSNLLLASFSCFAAFGVLFLQFGIGISQERTKSWYHYLRTLPVSNPQLFAARFICSYLFAFLSVGAIVALSLAFTTAELSSLQWIYFSIGLTTGGLVFCIMGLCLGYWSTEKSALPIGNLIYLPLSFAGGLWKPPILLPETLQEISVYLPTRQYGEILWKIVDDTNVTSRSISTLIIYFAIFLLISFVGLRKDYNTRIR